MSIDRNIASAQQSDNRGQIVVQATPSEDGLVIDVSSPTPQQFDAWARNANDDAHQLESRATSLEHQATQLLARAKEARDAAQVLRSCITDKTILPTDRMCRVCVAKTAESGWGNLMTNCGDCNIRPIHKDPNAPFQHRSTEHIRKLLA